MIVWHNGSHIFHFYSNYVCIYVLTYILISHDMKLSYLYSNFHICTSQIMIYYFAKYSGTFYSFYIDVAFTLSISNCDINGSLEENQCSLGVICRRIFVERTFTRWFWFHLNSPFNGLTDTVSYGSGRSCHLVDGGPFNNGPQSNR